MNLYSANHFYTMVFTSVVLRIMINLVGFLKPFTVCITIKAIPTFPLYNYSPLLFIIIFFSFFFLLVNASAPHIIFSVSQL